MLQGPAGEIFLVVSSSAEGLIASRPVSQCWGLDRGRGPEFCSTTAQLHLAPALLCCFAPRVFSYFRSSLYLSQALQTPDTQAFGAFSPQSMDPDEALSTFASLTGAETPQQLEHARQLLAACDGNVVSSSALELSTGLRQAWQPLLLLPSHCEIGSLQAAQSSAYPDESSSLMHCHSKYHSDAARNQTLTWWQLHLQEAAVDLHFASGPVETSSFGAATGVPTQTTAQVPTDPYAGPNEFGHLGSTRVRGQGQGQPPASDAFQPQYPSAAMASYGYARPAA